MFHYHNNEDMHYSDLHSSCSNQEHKFIQIHLTKLAQFFTAISVPTTTSLHKFYASSNAFLDQYPVFV